VIHRKFFEQFPCTGHRRYSSGRRIPVREGLYYSYCLHHNATQDPASQFGDYTNGAFQKGGLINFFNAVQVGSFKLGNTLGGVVDPPLGNLSNFGMDDAW